MNCSECDTELEPDEPQTCYFTGETRHCGDCRDPRTNKPPYEGGCFRPIICDTCKTFPGPVTFEVEVRILRDGYKCEFQQCTEQAILIITPDTPPDPEKEYTTFTCEKHLASVILLRAAGTYVPDA